jgi:pentatricopeptide repeat protein
MACLQFACSTTISGTNVSLTSFRPQQLTQNAHYRTRAAYSQLQTKIYATSRPEATEDMTSEAATAAPISEEIPTAAPTPEETRVRTEVTRRIKELGRQGKAREAVGELAAMARLGVQPDTQSATALLDACMRSKKVEIAESVFDELFNGLLSPDEVTFAVMLRGYGSQEPPRWTAISNAIATMEKDFGITASTLTYNALLDICSKTNDITRGSEIITRMVAAGVEPDDFTLEAVRQRKSLRSLIKKTF